MGGIVSFESFECGRCTLPQRECEPDVRDVTPFPKFREVGELQMPNGVQETVRVIMTERPDIQEAVRMTMNEGVPLQFRPDIQAAIAQVMIDKGVPFPDIQTMIDGRVPIPMECPIPMGCQMMNEGRPLHPDVEKMMRAHPFINPIVNPIVGDECVKTKRNKRRRRQREPRCRNPRVDEGNEIVFKDEESREQFVEIMKGHEDATDPFAAS